MDNSRHILIIPSEYYVPQHSPLQGIFQQDQAQALSRAGYKVGIISPPELRSLLSIADSSSGRQNGFFEDNDRGIPVLRYYGWNWFPRFYTGKTWLWLRAGKALYNRYASKYGAPDVIHAHNALYAGFLAAAIKEQSGTPYVLTEHSSAYARGLFRADEIIPIRSVFKNAEKRLFVSPSLAHDVEKLIGDAARPWDWVPNILDIRFERGSRTNLQRKHDDQKFYFINVGSLVEVKGQDNLLQAFATRFKGNHQVNLKICGGGPLYDKLTKLAQELGVASQVSFLGELSREQILDALYASDVYVQSSHYETFGVSIIEALSCGKPAVATACGGPASIINDKNGLLVPDEDVERLGQAMMDVKENFRQYDPVWIREDCIARFGEQAVVRKLSEIYANLEAPRKIFA